ncbi:MAG: hypothetical protein KGS46_20285 [Chloroflexi bacterium]|nr:hypothetical protein [Chloroflexota bacterium]
MADKPAITINKPATGAISAAATTTKRPPGKTTTDKTVRRGVGLKSSTMTAIQQIAEETRLTENAIMRFLIEHGATEYLANGPIKADMKKRIKTHVKIE